MGSIATMKFGFIFAVVMAGAVVAAFLAYMSIFGRRSSLRQKNMTETDESV
jgi:purine-cytosine permease-like protein